MITLGELKGMLSKRLDDPTNAVYSEADIVDFINWAIRALAGYGFRRLVVAQPQSVGNNEYELDVDELHASDIVRVRVLDAYGSEQDTTFYAYEDSGTLPTTKTTVRIRLESSVGNTDTIKAFCAVPHPALVNTSDVCEIPTEPLLLYAAYLAHSKSAQNKSQIDRKFHIEERDTALSTFLNTYRVFLPRYSSVPLRVM